MLRLSRSLHFQIHTEGICSFHFINYHLRKYPSGLSQSVRSESRHHCVLKKAELHSHVERWLVWLVIHPQHGNLQGPSDQADCVCWASLTRKSIFQKSTIFCQIWGTVILRKNTTTEYKIHLWEECACWFQKYEKIYILESTEYGKHAHYYLILEELKDRKTVLQFD